MNSKIQNPDSSPSANRMNATLEPPRFLRRLTTAAAVQARFSGSAAMPLIDPHFIDRLRTPLTRYHD
jgi:hypothetical protein